MRHELLSNLVQSPHLTAFNLSVSKSMFQFLSVEKEGELCNDVEDDQCDIVNLLLRLVRYPLN